MRPNGRPCPLPRQMPAGQGGTQGLGAASTCRAGVGLHKDPPYRLNHPLRPWPGCPWLEASRCQGLEPLWKEKGSQVCWGVRTGVQLGEAGKEQVTQAC